MQPAISMQSRSIQSEIIQLNGIDPDAGDDPALIVSDEDGSGNNLRCS